MTRADVPDACTVKQTAAFLGVSVRTVYRLEKSGDLPTTRLPQLCRAVRFDGAKLRAYGTEADLRKRASAALKLAAGQ